MIEFRGALDRKMGNGGEVSFLYRGGVGLQFVMDSMHEAAGYDMLVVMAGGNDLASGAPEAYFDYCYDRILLEARRLRIKATVFTSLWPRQNAVYNTKLKQINKNMLDKYKGHLDAVFWQWDKRQPMRTYDRVHLERRGYERAIGYLVAAIVWTKNHKF